MTPPAIARWLDFMERGQINILEDLLAEDAVFYSPVMFTPQQGRTKVAGYLCAAEQLFSTTNFHYVAQWFDSNSAVLEFSADLEGVHVEGVDIVYWNDEDKITSFKVMVRPLKATQTVMSKMGELLSQAQQAGTTTGSNDGK